MIFNNSLWLKLALEILKIKQLKQATGSDL